jgi:glycerophosphoryl diester phosphodiesterase
MHDATLDRTTDVASLYPQRSGENASQFTMAELKSLNAGGWFLARHPASSLPAGLVSAIDADAYLGETIPTLEEWLRLVKQYKLTVIFDLLPPPADHPYADRFYSLAIEQIRQANIADQVWFLVGNEEPAIARSDIAGFRPAHSTDYTHPPSVSELRSLGFEIVNSEYGLSAAWIAKYVRAGIHVNVWTVDEVWQFSRLWLMGVNSVTTNNLAGFAAMQRPYLAIPYGWFALAWCAAGVMLGGYAALRIWKWKQK